MKYLIKWLEEQDGEPWFVRHEKDAAIWSAHQREAHRYDSLEAVRDDLPMWWVEGADVEIVEVSE